uniref:F-box associated beta-propeller type 1 domain-containing protein n=1 Tax=Solanum lycopersicum TaxID=4081 RepID=A0A3Q7JAW9_SOLLC
MFQKHLFAILITQNCTKFLKLAGFVNGKLYWTSSTCINKYKVCHITSFHLADGTWGSLELPSCGKDNSDINLGAMGSDLSLLYTCQRGAATSDIWIMKLSRVNVSWTILFTIKYPLSIKTHSLMPPADFGQRVLSQATSALLFRV